MAKNKNVAREKEGDEETVIEWVLVANPEEPGSLYLECGRMGREDTAIVAEITRDGTIDLWGLDECGVEKYLKVDTKHFIRITRS